MKLVTKCSQYQLCLQKEIRDWIWLGHVTLVTALGGKPKPEICTSPRRLRWTLLPKERYGDSLSGRGSNTRPSNWEVDILPPSYCRPKVVCHVQTKARASIYRSCHSAKRRCHQWRRLRGCRHRSVTLILWWLQTSGGNLLAHWEKSFVMQFELILWTGCSQPKIFERTKKFRRAEMFDFRRETVFCLGHLLPKNIITGYAKNFGERHVPLATPMIMHWWKIWQTSV